MTISESAPVPPAPPSGGFDSGAAAFHGFTYASRTGWGPLIRLGVIYMVVSIAGLALFIASMAPFLSLMTDLAALESDPKLAATTDLPPGFWPAVALFTLGYLAYLVFYLVLYAVIDAALLRWLMGRGGRVRLGGDELRLMVIGLLWMLVLPLVVFAPFWLLLIAAVAGGSASPVLAWSAGTLSVLAFIGGFVAWLWLAARLAPAAALTVRDGRLQAFGGWTVTRGVFWPLLGAFVIVWAIYLGASMGSQLVMQPFLFLAGGEIFTLTASLDPAQQPDPQEIFDALLSPAMLAVFAVWIAISLAVYYAFQALLAGVNVYLLNTRRL